MYMDILEERVHSLVNDGLYRVANDPDKQTGEIVVYGDVLGQPPMHELSAIIGDVVHNLRSALDHLIWQLTVEAGHTPPPNPIPKRGPGSEWRSIGFPIYVNPYPPDHLGNLIPWATSKEPKSLWGIGPRLRADLQALQPFNYGQDAPRKPLAVLEELWNIDKHRHFHLALFHMGLRDVRSSSKEFKFRVLKKHAPGPLKSRTEIGRAKQVRGRWHPLVHMYMDSEVAFSISFDQGPPAYGKRVNDTLISLHDTVAAILGRFDSEFM